MTVALVWVANNYTGGFMSWTYRIFWAAAVIASLSLAACGQMKEENNGRPTVASKGPADPSPRTGDAGVSTSNVIEGKPVTLEIAEINSDSSNATAEDSSFVGNFTASVNGKSFTKALSLNTTSTPYGSAYELVDNWHVYWVAKCEATDNCNYVYLTVMATDINGKKWVQVGALKSFISNTLKAKMAYPTAKDTVVSPAVISIDDMATELKKIAQDFIDP